MRWKWRSENVCTELSRMTVCVCVWCVLPSEPVWNGARLDLISPKHGILRKYESGEEVWGENDQLLHPSSEPRWCKTSRVWTWSVETLTRASPLCWRPRCLSPEYPRSHLCSRSTCKKKHSSAWRRTLTRSVLDKLTPAEPPDSFPILKLKTLLVWWTEELSCFHRLSIIVMSEYQMLYPCSTTPIYQIITELLCWQKMESSYRQTEQCPSHTLVHTHTRTRLHQYLCRALELVVPASAARAWSRSWPRTRAGPGAGAAVAAVFPLLLQRMEKRFFISHISTVQGLTTFTTWTQLRFSHSIKD